MTDRRDRRSFEQSLDDAVQNMHRDLPRGNQPSSRVWSQIAAEAGISEEDGPDTRNANRSIGKTQAATRRRAMGSGRRSYLGWSTWLAAALVVVLIGAGVRFLVPENNPNTREHSIALAPGTPDMSMFSSIEVATPFASPNAYVPEYGPEYACHAEPLTADQIFDIVINPSRERVRRGSEQMGSTDEPREGLDWISYPRLEPGWLVPVDTPESRQELIDTSNQFWNCLMTGSSFQVWGLMAPENVQMEILSVYPVLRDETVLRQHIEEWGPRPYRDALHQTFPDLGNADPLIVAMMAGESERSVQISAEMSWAGMVEHNRAQVTMIPPPEAGESSRWADLIIQIEFTRAADGTWWANRVVFTAP